MKKKVLIIEDDKDTLEILAHLTRDLNVECELCCGSVSLSEIKKIDPNLVLLDHWLNDGYGDELCRQIKGDATTAHIPVVMVSAHLEIAEIAAQCRANGYLAKPFDIDDLQAIISK